jgi:hypothetical protein
MRAGDRRLRAVSGGLGTAGVRPRWRSNTTAPEAADPVPVPDPESADPDPESAEPDPESAEPESAESESAPESEPT